MKETKISLGQLLAAVYLGLTALAAEALPGRIGGGGLAWLSPLLLLIPALPLVGWAARKNREGAGSGGLTALLRTGGGRVMAAVFLLWGIFLLGVNVSRSARRLSAGGGEGALLALLILAMGVWMAWGRIAAFGRSCELFSMAFGLGLLLVVLFAIFKVQPDYVLLATWKETVALPGGILSTLGVAGMGIYALFLGDDVERREKDRGRMVRWTAALLITQGLLLLLVLGRLGAGLTAMVERPFFQMVAGIGLAGAFQRLEALISALWLLGDLALVGLLLFACRRLLGMIVGKQEKPWFAIFPAVPAVVLAWGILGQEGLSETLFAQVIPVGGLLAGGLAFLLWGVGQKRTIRK